jgi:Type I phosphodiesterase / nucleotide pyrophosphatase
MRPRHTITTSALTLALLIPAGAACSQNAAPDTGRVVPASARATLGGGAADRAGTTRVLAISVDGLNTNAIRRLGSEGTPTLHRLIDEGAFTLNARTEREQTVTLPNHTSMMTGRRINAARGGHGVTWDNDRRRSTVQEAARHGVASIFSIVHASGQSTALFSTKEKFGLYERSWRRGIDRFTADERQAALVRAARRDLVETARAFTFLHVSLPDRAGHEFGGMSPQYLDAVRRTDRLLGTVLRAVDTHEQLAAGLTVILTADHGFAPGVRDHSARALLANYRIPFIVWGAGVSHGSLYGLNPDYANPGRARPGYAGTQPVRNGDVADLAADLLGLRAVPGSEFDADQDLDVSR